MKNREASLLKNKVQDLYSQEGVWRIDESPEYACFHKELEEYKKMAGAEKGDLYLEIGAGRGRVLTEFTGKYRKLVAIDISDKMVGSLKDKHYGNLYIIKADAENLPFKDSIFDLVLAPAVIGHCADPLKIALGMKRVMKNNGMGIISTTANSLSIPGLFGQIKSFLKHKSFSREFFLLSQGYCRDSYFFIRKILLEAKLKIQKVSGTGMLPTYLSMRAKKIEKMSSWFPFKFFSRVIIISFKK